MKQKREERQGYEKPKVEKKVTSEQLERDAKYAGDLTARASE
jgi:hypothetical protein